MKTFFQQLLDIENYRSSRSLSQLRLFIAKILEIPLTELDYLEGLQSKLKSKLMENLKSKVE